MNVQIQCEHARGQAVAARLRRRARAFLAKLGKADAELSILLVGDRGMRRLNRTWRGKDVPTDVLSFPAAGSAGALLGDVVLSLDTAARVARAERRPMEEELDRYLVHGILHLLGFDHERGPDEASDMASREEQVLGEEGMVAAAGKPERPGKGAGKARKGPASTRGAVRKGPASTRGAGKARKEPASAARAEKARKEPASTARARKARARPKR